jgi:hypothetical protein
MSRVMVKVRVMGKGKFKAMVRVRDVVRLRVVSRSSSGP